MEYSKYLRGNLYNFVLVRNLAVWRFLVIVHWANVQMSSHAFSGPFLWRCSKCCEMLWAYQTTLSFGLKGDYGRGGGDLKDNIWSVCVFIVLPSVKLLRRVNHLLVLYHNNRRSYFPHCHLPSSVCFWLPKCISKIAKHTVDNPIQVTPNCNHWPTSHGCIQLCVFSTHHTQMFSATPLS